MRWGLRGLWTAQLVLSAVTPLAAAQYTASDRSNYRVDCQGEWSRVTHTHPDAVTWCTCHTYTIFLPRDGYGFGRACPHEDGDETCTCEIASLEMAVGKDSAPLVLAAGSLAALATLTLLAVTVRRRAVAHVLLAESDECDDAEPEASTLKDKFEDQEREELTALV